MKCGGAGGKTYNLLCRNTKTLVFDGGSSSSTTHFINQLNQTKSKETFNLIWFHWFLQLVDEINGIELNCIITVWVILWIWYKDKIIDGINLLMESIMNYLYEYEKYYRRCSNQPIQSSFLFENEKREIDWFDLLR